MHYRPEIDGLRAVAVVPVILFHAGFSGLSGGFVGVDVFFVISGYLITTLLLDDLATGRFSLAAFYERRARRILPALFFVMAVSAAVAWVTLMPKDMEAFSRSVAATALFGSNLLFWKEAGYFDTASELKPLLHTWSLSIEEQFYILFPLVLMLVWARARRWLMPLVALAFLASFSLGHWGAIHKPSSAFYLLPTRAWELLIGVWCGIYLFRYGQPVRGARAGGVVGLGMILMAVILYDNRTLWPGMPALLPTLGTAFVILFAAPHTLAGRLLSQRLLVGLGLISYSAYLWHQPLFAFARYRHVTTLPPEAMALLVLVTLGLAWVSWRYVEQPFRRGHTPRRGVILGAGGLGLVAFAGLGLAGALSDGFPKGRIPQNVAALAAYAHDDNPMRKDCFSGPGSYVAPENACVLGDADAVRGVLLGDSHSDAIAWPLHTGLEARGIGLRHMWLNGCPPVRNIRLLHRPWDATCRNFNAAVFDLLAGDPTLEYVVLSARFNIYLEGETYDNSEGGVETPGHFAAGHAMHHNTSGYPEDQRRADVQLLYLDSIRELLAANKTVILIYPVPEQGWNVPMHMAKRLFYSGQTQDLSVSYASFRARNARLITTFDSLGQHPRLRRIRPSRIFCNTYQQGRCSGSWDKVPFYYDDDHLSNSGAELLTPRILDHIPARPLRKADRQQGPDGQNG